jgi:glutaryl-CoA dehydrogenase
MNCHAELDPLEASSLLTSAEQSQRDAAARAVGSEEQKARWLPRLRSGEALGCFALTEPQSGSDPASLQTRAVREGASFRLSGHKRWATNGNKAAVAVVWAKTEGDDARGIRGFLVERGQFQPRPIPGKMSLRASDSAELILDGAVGEARERPAWARR